MNTTPIKDILNPDRQFVQPEAKTDIRIIASSDGNPFARAEVIKRDFTVKVSKDGTMTFDPIDKEENVIMSVSDPRPIRPSFLKRCVQCVKAIFQKDNVLYRPN